MISHWNKTLYSSMKTSASLSWPSRSKNINCVFFAALLLVYYLSARYPKCQQKVSDPRCKIRNRMLFCILETLMMIKIMNQSLITVTYVQNELHEHLLGGNAFTVVNFAFLWSSCKTLLHLKAPNLYWITKITTA